MYKSTNRLLSIITAFFMCFNNLVTPIYAEGEEIPEATEEPVTEVIQEEESAEEALEVAEEVTQEQEETEPEAETAPEEEKDPAEEETGEEGQEGTEVIPEPETEITEEPAEVINTELEENQEEATEEESSEEITAEEEEESSKEYATPASDFTYTISNNTVKITKYTGSDTDVEIPSEIDGYPVTSIGERVFQNNSTLTSVIIPNSVERIEKLAFSYCTRLRSITVPKSVTYIATRAFEYCRGLNKAGPIGSDANIQIEFSDTIDLTYNACYLTGTGDIYNSSGGLFDYLESIEIPDGVTTIAKYAFYRCTNLTSITIPRSVKNIEISAFYYCTALQGVYIEDISKWLQIDFENLYSNPLYYAKTLYVNGSKLQDLTIPSNVTKIGNFAFCGCTSLSNVIIPDRIIKIGNDAFNGCINLMSIMIPDSISTIEENTFKSCSNLTSITIPNSVTSIKNSAFEDCTSLTEVEIPNSVTSIGNCAFQNCINLINCIIPNSISSIGDHAFYGCSKLKTIGPIGSDANVEIEFDQELTDVYNYYDEDTTIYTTYLFSYAEEIVIPPCVKEIVGRAFSDCTNLKSIILPEGLTHIGYGAFDGCSNLSGVVIPESVITIEGEAFDGCTSLNAVNIPNTVTSIGSQAFSNCTGLTKIEIPYGVTKIAYRTFYNCSNLTSISLPNSVKTIESSAFENCSKLTDIVIPTSVTYIGASVFSGCSSITRLEGQSICVEASSLQDCSSLEIVDLKELNNINANSFEDFANLTRVGLIVSETIGSYAFLNCSNLTEVHVSNSVKEIDLGTFRYCADNMKVYFYGSQDEWNQITIKNYNDSLLSANIIFRSPIESLSVLEGNSINIPVSQTTQIHYSSIPETIDPSRLVWTSEDESIATVDEQGNVTGISEGSTTINVSVMYGDQSASITVNVTVIHVESVSINPGQPSMYTGEMQQLTATVSPINALLKDVTWFSSNSDVATIDENGLITALKAGTTTITVTADDGGFTDSFELTVLQHAAGLSLSDTSLELPIRDTAQLVPVFSPSNTSNKNVNWSSSNNSVATVDSTGLVTTVSEGTAIISAVAEDGGFSARCVVTAYAVHPNSVVVTADYQSVSLNETIHLNAEVQPANTTNPSVTWSSSDENIVTVDANGIVTGKGNGTAIITATTVDGNVSGSIEIQAIVPAAGIALTNNNLEIVKGQSEQLSFVFTPENTSNKNVIWSSGDESVATVDENGVVTAVEGGTTIITVLSEDGGYTAKCEVKVVVLSEFVSIVSDVLEVICGETAQLEVMVLPENTTNKEVIWSSNNPGIVSVDSNGKITGRGNGVAQITVTTKDTGVFATVDIQGIVLAGEIQLSDQKLDIVKGNSAELSATILPNDATNKTVLWSSSDESVAAVDSNGRVTAVEGGTAIITATSEDGRVSASAVVHVIVMAEGITVDEENTVSEIEYGKTGSIQISFEPYNTTNQKLIWISSDENIAIVDENGVVTAVGEGPVTITATSEDGGFSVSTEVVVLFTHIESVELAEKELVLGIGAEEHLHEVIYPEDSSVKKVNWRSNDESIVTVDENGKITTHKEGRTTVTVTTVDGGLTAEMTVIVYPGGIYVSGLEDVYEYTGTAIKPALNVYDTGKLLQVKTDYTVTYKNTTKAYYVADPENPTATDKKKAPQVIIKSNKKGNYAGTKTVYFSIDPVDLYDDRITVDELSVQATGKTLSPVPVVYFNGKKLKNKTDYTVSYENYGDRTTSGEHTVTITGKGNFTGTREVKVYVAPKEQVSVSKLSVTSKPISYAELTGDPENDLFDRITVKNGKSTVLSREAEDYYMLNVPEDYAHVGMVSFVIQGNEAKGYYGKRTVTVKIIGISLTDKKVKPASLSYPYTGEEIKISAGTSVLTYNGTPLTEGTDYEIVSYAANKNAGKATVTVKGINNYTGTKKLTFTITPDTSSKESMVSVADAYYSKGGSKPKVTVEDLTEGTDYTVKYSNNTKANTEGTAVISFKGNYKGTPSVTRTFHINLKPFTEISVTASDVVYSAKAGKYKSTPILTDTDGKKLKAGTDYEKTYTYEEVDENGTVIRTLTASDVVETNHYVRVTVTGKGNYTNETVSAVYRVTAASIAKGTFKIKNQEYTGRSITLDPAEGDITKAVVSKKDLTYGTDYIITGYTNNVKKGTATVTFQGIGNYGGTKTVKFKIVQRNIGTWWKGILGFLN